MKIFCFLVIALVVLGAGAPVIASPAAVPRSFTIAAAGDIIPHGMLVDAGNAYLTGPGWDFTPMIRDIEPWVSSADLSICHLEGTLSATNTGISGFVDARGRILFMSELFERGQYRAELATSSRGTLYTAWGDWLPKACVLLSLGLLFAAHLASLRARRHDAP